MKIHQLRYFLQIIESGSISRAAQTLGVAQPALSQHVANLEHELGAKILDRTSVGVSSTPAGDELCDHARTILRQIEQARLDVGHIDRTPRGEVVVVLASSAAGFIAPPLAVAVERAFPEIRITALEAMSIQASELVENGHADLGLLPNGHLLRKVEALHVSTEHLYFGGRCDMGMAGDAPIDFKDACAVPLILPSRPHFLRNKLEQTAFDHGLQMDVRADQDSTRLLLSYIEAGYAYSILPWPSFYEGVQAGRLFARKVINPTVPRLMTIAWAKHRPLSKAAKVVAAELQRLVSDLHSQGVLRGELSDPQNEHL
jgi:LysR family nitrogen assimilation transcriptional regulator